MYAIAFICLELISMAVTPNILGVPQE